MKTIKCWGIPYGLTSKQTEELTIEMRCKTIREFKNRMKESGHKLTSKPYIN